MVHSGVVYISSRRWGPKRRGVRGSLLPYPTLSTALDVIQWCRVHRLTRGIATGWRLPTLTPTAKAQSI